MNNYRFAATLKKKKLHLYYPILLLSHQSSQFPLFFHYFYVKPLAGLVQKKAHTHMHKSSFLKLILFPFYSTVKYDRIKFLVIASRDSVEIYAWAPKPYHKFMVFKSFPDLTHKPLLVDMTIEEGIRFKVIYGSKEGFHAVDLDNGQVYDIYTPAHVCHNF